MIYTTYKPYGARHHDYDLLYDIFTLELYEKPEIIINPEEHQGYQRITPADAQNLPNAIEDLSACLQIICKYYKK